MTDDDGKEQLRERKGGPERVVSRLSRWTGIAQVVIAIASCTIAYVAITATREQAELSRRQARLSARAWLLVEGVGVVAVEGAGVVYTAIVLNTGDTPALDVRLQSSSKSVPKGTVPDFKYEEGPKRLGVVGPRVKYPIEFPARPDISDKTRFVYGRIEYRDTLGCPHWTRFCGMYDLASKAFVACDQYNEIDRDDQAECSPEATKAVAKE